MRSRSSRRSFLATLGASAAIAPTVISAVDLDSIDSTYSHVSTEYEESTLQDYQPLLLMESEDRGEFKYLLSYVARSDQYDTYACCYIARYSLQSGTTSVDSHRADTEPVYVFVDKDTDEVTEIVATAWHWNAAGVYPEDASLTSDRTSAETHISMDVVQDWHHYQFRDDGRGVFKSLEDWHDHRQSLVDNGLYDRGAPEAFEEPWTMSADHEKRGGWWNTEGAVNVDLITMRVWDLLGIRGADTQQQDLR